jgi:hypothetical protein
LKEARYGPQFDPLAGWCSDSGNHPAVAFCLSLKESRFNERLKAYKCWRRGKGNFLAFEAEPGRIMHETRNREMARLGEVPFRLYYGSVDATPLFVMLVFRPHGGFSDDCRDLAKYQGSFALVRSFWRRRR